MNKDNVYYHGSLKSGLKILKPYVGKTPDGKQIPRIFAAKDFIYALLNTHIETISSPDEYLQHGFYTKNGVRQPWYLKELVKGGLKLYSVSASIYVLSKDDFEDVQKGIVGEEFVSYKDVKVIYEIKISNVLEKLLSLEKDGLLIIERY